MKGVWLPIQSVSGYPDWTDFSASEASAAEQALMCGNEQEVAAISRSHALVFCRLARCGVTDIFVDVWNNGSNPECVIHALLALASYYHQGLYMHPVVWLFWVPLLVPRRRLLQVSFLSGAPWSIFSRP